MPGQFQTTFEGQESGMSCFFTKDIMIAFSPIAPIPMNAIPLMLQIEHLPVVWARTQNLPPCESPAIYEIHNAISAPQNASEAAPNKDEEDLFH
ncbi:hypothetical protein TNCV_4538161 [Trichonephila clavipes]|nr:hypothetical protein TNCV_4538161 [Trichonephila clavipes]